MPVIESKIKDSPCPKQIYVNIHIKISFASVFNVCPTSNNDRKV